MHGWSISLREGLIKDDFEEVDEFSAGAAGVSGEEVVGEGRRKGVQVELTLKMVKDGLNIHDFCLGVGGIRAARSNDPRDPGS